MESTLKKVPATSLQVEESKHAIGNINLQYVESTRKRKRSNADNLQSKGPANKKRKLNPDTAASKMEVIKVSEAEVRIGEIIQFPFIDERDKCENY